ncbi:membrane-associated oxidoreductase [Streptomyces lincolnensis]|uniref:Membrane-associated oxidoreductase n=1 Tax=Streptomyces lincolnensis TaxID=1915 RepID=A0A1B1MLL8_STRLN|nr:membrane-associated oxidoreductase [Streptomyces lincolnensis]ANS69282.1 membrane-associated oxidoreductase [Streptomyces lincolnensis]AXG58201.1 membrane-associated oxidoreductase [Streptomyces lincolnensis]QMV10865.1 membrane-associated oxidoreductase [Streptomyces lincolnensis]
MEIDNLTPAELRVWRAFPRGESVNFRTADDEDTAEGADWGPERTVRAAVLRALLLSGPQEEGEIPALKLAGARISGTLDLRYGTCDHAVRLSHCHFAGVPQLYGARLRQLNLSNSVLPGLTAGATRVEGVLRLSDCVVRGPVRLGGAQIANALFMERARLIAQDPSEPVLQLNQMTTGDDLWAPGLEIDGEMRLNGANIAGSINMNEARLTCPGRHALDAETLTVEGDFLMRHAQVRGWIGLRGARVTGRLDLSYASLVNPGDTALRASSCTIGELWLRRGSPMQGALNLRRAQTEVLFLEPEAVPDEVLLNNLVYTTLTPHEPAERRLAMLERDRDGYVPHAYEQLTASYLRIGDDRAARLVQLAKQRRHRRTLPWYGRLWGHVQDATVGYGFRPLRACVWLLSLLAIGSVAYGLHHPRPLKPSEAPDFNPVFYTLDLLLPVISFGQESAFAPDDGYQTLSYALVISGWILATTVFAGVTRTVSRQ